MTNQQNITLVQRGNTFKLIPSSLEEAIRISEFMSKTSLVPVSYKNKLEDMTLAILMGADIGLSAIQSIENIDRIQDKNGNVRFSIRVPILKCLVLSSSLCDYIREEEAKDETGKTIGMQVVVKRKDCEERVFSYTVEEAKKRGLWGKKGAWSSEPRSMLITRATGRALKRVFPDVIGGFYESTEELEDRISEQQDEPLTASQYIEKHFASESDDLADLLESKNLDIESDTFEDEGD